MFALPVIIGNHTQVQSDLADFTGFGGWACGAGVAEGKRMGADPTVVCLSKLMFIENKRDRKCKQYSVQEKASGSFFPFI